MPVLSPLYRWVKLCHRSLRIWIHIHIEFHWASVQESHRMLIIMNKTFLWLVKSLNLVYEIFKVLQNIG